MTCNDVQRQIIAAEQGLPPAAAAHLDGCAACRAFAQVHGRLSSSRPGPVPRADLDRQVLDAVRVQLSARRRATPQARRDGDEERQDRGLGRAILPFPTVWWAATAAAVTVGLVVAALFLGGGPGPSGPTVAQVPAPAGAAAEPDWRALDLDTDMLALAVDLAMHSSATVTVASGADEVVGGVRATTAAGATRNGSIDDAILELELNLLLDEGLTIDTDQSDGV